MSTDWDVYEDVLNEIGLSDEEFSAHLDNMNEHEVVQVMEMLSVGKAVRIRASHCYFWRFL